MSEGTSSNFPNPLRVILVALPYGLQIVVWNQVNWETIRTLPFKCLAWFQIRGEDELKDWYHKTKLALLIFYEVLNWLPHLHSRKMHKMSTVFRS